jgi:hypothetical protein
MARPLLPVLGCVLALGCSDTYRDRLIDALGEEDAGFDPGPLHRPGQPCVACHSSYGGVSPEFSIAGTLFSQPTPEQPPFLVADFAVYLIDSVGNRRFVQANPCGNFYLEKSEFDPSFPMLAEVWDKGRTRPLAQMNSRIGRDGSCGTCHRDPPTWDSPGVVFVPTADLAGAVPPPLGACPPPRFAPSQIPVP